MCMKKMIFAGFLFLMLSLKTNAASYLYNEYSYLQDVTFELYTDDIPAYKVPEDMKSIEEVLMFNVMHATWIDKHWVSYTLNKSLLGKYKVGQPALSDNGSTKKIFFVANFPGSIGGLDIYTAEYNNGKWSKPRNLGKDVNTEYNESNPGLLNENTLTYSSNGIIKKLDLKILKVVNLEDNFVKNITNNNNNKANENLAAIGDNSSATPTGNNDDNNYGGAIGDNSSAAPAKTMMDKAPNYKAQEQIVVQEKKATETVKSTVNTQPTKVVENNDIAFLGVQSRETMLAKYNTAIQLGAYSSPKWDLIKPLNKYGKIISYKNENGANVVWLVGYANRAAAEAVLPQVKATPGFENAYVTGK